MMFVKDFTAEKVEIAVIRSNFIVCNFRHEYLAVGHRKETF
jgi:hypothetical protein